MAGEPLTLLSDGTYAERLHYDEASDTFAIEKVEDVEGVLDWCRGRYNEGVANRRAEFRQLASLPVTVLEIHGKARGLPPGWYFKKQYHDELVKAAHHPDLAGFRTMAGTFLRKDETA